MRTFLGLLVLVFVFGMVASGCGGSSEPQDPSKFDKAAYDDVNAAAKTLSEDKAVSH